MLHDHVSASLPAFRGHPIRLHHNRDVPIYEFICEKCRRKSSDLIAVADADLPRKCPKCGHEPLKRVVSRFRRGRSEDERLDEITDQLERRGDPDSPTEMREMLREMGHALDEGIPDEMEALFESEVAGELDESGSATENNGSE